MERVTIELLTVCCHWPGPIRFNRPHWIIEWVLTRLNYPHLFFQGGGELIMPHLQAANAVLQVLLSRELAAV